MPHINRRLYQNCSPGLPLATDAPALTTDRAVVEVGTDFLALLWRLMR